MANNGFDATAIVASGGNLFVGGSDSGLADYVYEFTGGGWTDISVVAGNGPASEVLSMALDGGSLLVGTAGGIWEYNGTWKDINGNLTDVEFNGIATDPTNPDLAYGAGEAISTSVYTGTQTWTQAPVAVGILSAVWNAGTVTVAMPAGVTYVVGEHVTVAGMTPAAYNGTFVITAATSTSFSYALVANPGAATVDGTAATAPGGLGVTNAPGALADLNGSSVAVDPNNANTIYAFMQGAPWAYNAELYVSHDGGVTWANTGVGTGIQTGDVVIDNLSRVFATTGGGVDVFNPTLGAWQNLGGLEPTSIAVAELQGPYVFDARFPTVSDLGTGAPDSNTIYLTDGQNIKVTKNYGNTWVPTAAIPNFVGAAAPNPTNVITDIEVNPTDRDYVYAVVGGTLGLPDTGTVWYSTDAGQTWTNISQGLPSANGLTSVSITNGGTGYTQIPTVTIAAPPAGGTQATAVATINSTGNVIGITFTNPGSGYVTAPAVTISAPGVAPAPPPRPPPSSAASPPGNSSSTPASTRPAPTSISPPTAASTNTPPTAPASLPGPPSATTCPRSPSIPSTSTRAPTSSPPARSAAAPTNSTWTTRRSCPAPCMRGAVHRSGTDRSSWPAPPPSA